MSKFYYYHELGDKYFDDYDECRDDLFNSITDLEISDWIEESYSKSDLADFILDLAENNNPQGEIESFISKIYEMIEQEWIFEGETFEPDEEGKCIACTFAPNCSRKNDEVTNCPKWAWVAWNHNDPFEER